MLVIKPVIINKHNEEMRRLHPHPEPNGIPLKEKPEESKGLLDEATKKPELGGGTHHKGGEFHDDWRGKQKHFLE